MQPRCHDFDQAKSGYGREIIALYFTIGRRNFFTITQRGRGGIIAAGGESPPNGPRFADVSPPSAPPAFQPALVKSAGVSGEEPQQSDKLQLNLWMSVRVLKEARVISSIFN